MTRRPIPHPILFGTHAVLFAYARNIEFAPSLGALVAWLALVGTAAALLTRAFARACRDNRKAAIVATALIVMFFSYGHLVNLLIGPFDNFRVLSVSIGPQKILACSWAVIGIGLARWMRSASPASTELTTIALNRAGAALVAVSAIVVATAVYSSERGSHGVWRRSRGDTGASLAGGPATAGRSPDIYYIILDDYARADVLSDVYDFDNRPFLDWLRAKGFYVTDESRANYLQTMLSLASSLNSAYLDPARLTSPAAGSDWHVALNTATARLLDPDVDPLRRPLVHMIQYSATVRTLKAHGYRFVALTSGFDGVQVPNADVVVRANPLSDFEESFLGTTPLAELTRFSDHDPLNLLRQHVRYALDHLADTGANDGPSFVFAHILSPHPPFFFTSDGTPVQVDDATRRLLWAGDVARTRPEDRDIVGRAYVNQLRFVNARVESAIERILARSGTPPIIVLQSDHGSDMLMDWSNPSCAALKERTGILNAYYVPREIRGELYPDISPVNTFRILLRHYFAGPYASLPDRTFFSTYERPYEFVQVAQP